MIQGITHFNSGNPGPKVGIMGGTHGDESCGVFAIQELEKYFRANPEKLLKGELYLILANPKAVELGVRGVEHDLNRLFTDEKPNYIESNSYDYLRAQELKPILEKMDFFIDLHSTGNPSVPFSVALERTDQHTRLLNRLPMNFASYGWKPHLEGTSLHWVEKFNGIGVAIEAGWQESPNGNEIALKSGKIFLNELNIAKFEYESEAITTKWLEILLKEKVEDPESFDYIEELNNFDSIKPGQIIAKDKIRNYAAPDKENLVIVFPTKIESIKKGLIQEAFLLGQFHDE